MDNRREGFMRVESKIAVESDEKQYRAVARKEEYDIGGHMNEKRKDAQRLLEIMLSEKTGIEERAFEALYVVFNSNNRLISRLAADMFIAAITREPRSGICDKCMEKLGELVFMDYRGLINVREPSTREQGVINDLEYTRHLAGETLVGLLAKADPDIDIRVWRIMEAAMDSESSRIIEVGNEMLTGAVVGAAAEGRIRQDR